VKEINIASLLEYKKNKARQRKQEFEKRFLSSYFKLSREFLISLFLVLCAGIYIFYYSREISLKALSKELVFLKLENKELVSRRNKLQKLILKLKTKDGIKKYAKNRLKMLEPGEIIIYPLE